MTSGSALALPDFFASAIGCGPASTPAVTLNLAFTQGGSKPKMGVHAGSGSAEEEDYFHAEVG